MDFTIRKATPKDYPGLAVLFDGVNYLHSNALPDIFLMPAITPQSQQYVDNIIKDKNALLLTAVAGDEIIGLIHAVIRESKDSPLVVKRKYAYIDEISVKPKFRRTSVGKKLMEAAEQWALDKGVNTVELNIWDFNKGGMAFFVDSGFKPSHHIMNKTIKKKE